MSGTYLIGVDFGSESARGVLVSTATGQQEGHHVHPYRHGIVTGELEGRPLPADFTLQVAADYTLAAEDILRTLGDGRDVAGIGIDFTASSPMPARADGKALSELFPAEPHAYVKLWKHAAQSYADTINSRGGAYLQNFGGKLSGEWMLAKAAQIRAEAPATWDAAERFIEAGDWLVWQLTGNEARSLDLAAYKAQFSHETGYPEGVVPGLLERLSPPLPVGSPAGSLTEDWRRRTGIGGMAAVAVAVIDSHVVLPAIGAVEPGVFVGALGTSAAFLILDGEERGLPAGLEGTAFGAVLPDLWCHEAGQAAFGDTLGWFVRTFPKSADAAVNFQLYDEAAAASEPGAGGLVALDWFAGNRIPFGDATLSGLLVGLGLKTTAAGIYRALVESLCFGARSTLAMALSGGVPIRRVVMTSGIARSNPFLIQIMADVFGRLIEVPEIENPTAMGAAIHGAVAARVVSSFAEGASRFGAASARVFEPEQRHAAAYETLFRQYRELAGNRDIQHAMHVLQALRATDAAPAEKPAIE